MAIDFSRVKVKLARAGRVKCEPQWQLDERWSAGLQDFDLWFVWSGRGMMQIDGEAVALAPGVCLWMRPGRVYRAQQDPSARLGVSYVHFDVHAGRRRIAERRLPPIVHRVSSVTWFEQATRRIVEIQQNSPRQHAVACSILEALLRELDGMSAAPAAAPDSRQRQVVLDAAMRIRENPSQRWTLPGLASAAGYCPDHFARLFTAACGAPPGQFVVACRIERAQQLLRETTLSIKEVARAAGYGSVHFFSRQFAQRLGLSPSQWRTVP